MALSLRKLSLSLQAVGPVRSRFNVVAIVRKSGRARAWVPKSHRIPWMELLMMYCVFLGVRRREEPLCLSGHREADDVSLHPQQKC